MDNVFWDSIGETEHYNSIELNCEVHFVLGPEN